MATINVGISDLNIAFAPDVLATYALGSCVGICLYDQDRQLAGLAHIMLPWSKEASNPGDNPFRYADTGITELVGGNVIIPFIDHFPKNSSLYRIMTTKPEEQEV